MRRAFSLALLGGLVTLSAGLAEDRKDRDSPIVGTWTIVSIEAGGKADDTITKGKIVIEGDTLAHVKPNGEKGSYGTIKLDPTKSPKEMDMTARDGPNKDATFPAIYELDGDSLKICMARTWARPTELKTKPGHQQLLYVLKRDKP